MGTHVESRSAGRKSSKLFCAGDANRVKRTQGDRGEKRYRVREWHSPHSVSIEDKKRCRGGQAPEKGRAAVPKKRRYDVMKIAIQKDTQGRKGDRKGGA